MCHEATSVGLPQSIGIGKGTVSLDDFDHCELIIAMGHNPGTNHPRMMGTLHEVRPARRADHRVQPAAGNARWSASPIRRTRSKWRRFGSTPIASTYYQVKVGGDAAALKGIMKALVARDDADGRACSTATSSPPTPTASRRSPRICVPTSWAAIEAASGLTRAALAEVAAAYAKSNATIVSYGMGITQHSTGTQNVQQIANLLLLRGNFGKPGAGICPLARPFQRAGRPHRRHHREARPGRCWNGSSRPSASRRRAAHGHDAVEAMQAIVEGRSKVLICLGGNLAVALPDPAQCFAGDAHARPRGAYRHQTQPLASAGRQGIHHPARAWAARSRISRRRAAIRDRRGFDVDGARLARQADAGVGATALGAGDHCRHGDGDAARQQGGLAGLIADYDRIRDKIEAVFPEFKDFNERIRHPGGFRLPLPPTERVWHTKSGKAEFIPFQGSKRIRPADGGRWC